MKVFVVLLALFAVSHARTYYPPCAYVKIPNGYLYPKKIQGYEIGTEVVVKCNEGYERKGYDSSYCTQYGFSPKLARCEEKVKIYKCGPRDGPVNGVVFPKEDYYLPNQVINFACGKGFVLKGKEKDICKSNGEWKYNEKVYCIRPCGPRYAPNNGEVNPEKDSYLPGEDITFSCDPYFYLVGKKSDVCLSNGNWKYNEKVFCKAFQCKARDAPSNGAVYPDKKYYDAGTVIKFSCNKYFKLFGAEKDVCKKDGSWKINGKVYCRAFCGSRKAPTDGSVSPDSNYYLEGTKITFSCSPGFKLIGKANDKCVGPNDWAVDDTPSCEEITCSARKAPANGFLKPVRTEYGVGVKIYFYCAKGFTLKGKSTDKCSEDGSWVYDDTPECVKYCYIGKVRPYIDYSPKKKYYEEGDMVEFECTKYYLSGTEKFTCKNDGKWSPDEDFPGCVRRCYLPKVINGGVKKPKKQYDAGESIEYYCKHGFSPSFDDGTCQKNGEWDQIATCEPDAKDCKGHSIKDGTVTPKRENYSSGTVIYYGCITGYSLKGDSSNNKCLENGNWKYAIPYCKKNPTPATCYKRCFQPPNYSFPCQCDSHCRKYRRCCKDFFRQCPISHYYV